MRREVIVHQDPKAPISEIFRTLRTNMQFMNVKGQLKTILVTSTLPGEGKSWVSANLATTFAQAGKKVILIDGGEFEEGKKILLPYLLNRKIKVVDYIIISHFDSDHARSAYFM